MLSILDITGGLRAIQVALAPLVIGWLRLPPEAAEAVPQDALTLDEAERRHILRTLQTTRGRIRGPGGAAERLGLHEATLRSRMKRLGIARPADGGA